MIRPLQSLLFYRVVTSLLSPILPIWLRRRGKAGKEDPARLAERFGRTDLRRPEGELIWLHGASVGETQMLRPLIDRLLEKPDRHVLITSGTITSASLLADQLPDRAIHQYLPVDTPRATARFIAYWYPTLAVFAESELWPNLIWTAQRASIPLALINARMSDTSLAGWRKRKSMARSVIGAFDTVLTADTRTSEGLSNLVGRPISHVGSLKYDAPALDFDADEQASVAERLGHRPIWLAASTHEAEEQVFFDLREQLSASHPDAFLIWLPRHPERGTAIAERLNAPQRSKGGLPGPGDNAYVMDTLGEMGLALSLSDVCVLGGAFHDSLMGHNPLEAARAGVPLITGPHTASFADLYRKMEADQAVTVTTVDDLAQAVSSALSGQISDQAKAASRFADSQSGALDLTVTKLEQLIRTRYEDDGTSNGAPS